MNKKALDSEPEIKDHLKQQLEYHEIRGEEASLIEQWFCQMIVAGDVLDLFRKKMIGVSGGRLTEDGGFEPRFYQKQQKQHE